MPTSGLFATVLAAVPLGIARHAIEIVRELAATKIASRSRQALSGDATMQASLGQAEAQLRSGRAFFTRRWPRLGERSMRGSLSPSPNASAGIERCLRDIYAACQHVSPAITK
jgi:alkylation response protein AidB-like acyl-CoA dehydrogenase